ncbi:MAG: ATP-binding protein [Gemmatimonadales bacterium]
MNRSGLGLRAKLLSLLLAFGVIPVVASIAVGYFLSRSVIIEQAVSALDVATGTQALHIATELDRQRLLLRTIAGQLPRELRTEDADRLAERLVQGLPEDGIFDGLRLAAGDGRVLASVGLGTTAPAWPETAPAAGWTDRSVVVHRHEDDVVAYLVGIPLDGRGDAFLEGHVRADDFARIFSTPEHLIRGAESVVLDRRERLVFAAHAHGAGEIEAAIAHGPAPSDDRVVVGATTLLARAPIAGTEWMVVSAMPIRVALAPLARLRNAAFLGATVLTLLVVATGVMAARSVTNPLRTLAGAAARLGRQESHLALPVRGSDEVAVVNQAFNTMAAALEQSRSSLQALHERDLERAQQLATVGELASGVAHEIRNPLTGVRGAIDLAARHLPPDGDARPLLREAEQQLERIEGATTQLLRFARPPELREIEADLRLIVERARTLVAAQAAAADVTVSVEVPPEPLVARVDPELMVQVLLNLLLNALEASPAEAAVRIELARRESEAAIAVVDCGPGVPDADKSTVFRPFYTTKHKGTGLGLSISRQIVNRHGGEIRIADAAGGGASFVVTLPLAQEGGSDR